MENIFCGFLFNNLEVRPIALFNFCNYNGLIKKNPLRLFFMARILHQTGCIYISFINGLGGVIIKLI